MKLEKVVQYFGDPINCQTSSGLESKVLDDYCWIHSTFHLRAEYQVRGPAESHCTAARARWAAWWTRSCSGTRRYTPAATSDCRYSAVIHTMYYMLDCRRRGRAGDRLQTPPSTRYVLEVLNRLLRIT